MAAITPGFSWSVAGSSKTEYNLFDTCSLVLQVSCKTLNNSWYLPCEAYRTIASEKNLVFSQTNGAEQACARTMTLSCDAEQGLWVRGQ